MAFYLTIDIGNSSAKASVWKDGEMAQPAIWGALSASDIEKLCECANEEIACAAVCSVSEDKFGLIEAARKIARRLIVVDSSTPTPISLTRYGTLATLGADRIAALNGAASLYADREMLVVDCGTAITYDRLSANREFLGGNIAPGLGMRLKALHTFTSRLPEVETNSNAPLWGHSTVEAMQAGALYGAVAEVQYYFSQAPDGTKLVLTGGRAADLSHYLPFDCTVDIDLVLRGLKYIIEYDENK